MDSVRVPQLVKRDSAASLLVLLVGLSGCVALFFYSVAKDSEQAKLHFRLLAEESISSIEKQITENSTTVAAVAAYFDASREVSRREFEVFVRPFICKNKSIRALQWVPRVLDKDRERYEANARRDGLSDFGFKDWTRSSVVRPAGVRSDYFVVYYNEPMSKNRAVTGVDNGSEPTRRQVLLDSAMRGSETYSPPVTLMQSSASQKGYLVYLPVYDRASANRTPEQRLGSLRGFATGVFLMDELLRSAVGRHTASPICLSITDTTDPRSKCALGIIGEPDKRAGGLSYDRFVTFGGRRWLFHAVPGRFYSVSQPFSAWVGLVFGLLSIAVIFVSLAYRSRATRMLGENEERFRELFNSLPVGAVLFEPEGLNFVLFNDTASRILGYSREEFSKLRLPDIEAAHGETEIAANVERFMNGEKLAFETKHRSKSGGTLDILVDAMRLDVGGRPSILAMWTDITERKEYEGLLDYQAHHDALTDLPNRLLFSRELDSVIADHGRHHKQCAVLFIDLDNFKIVNDTMGHQVGDALLVEVAARLASCMREGDMLARMGGDEFTVLLKGLRSTQDTAMIAQRMLEHVSAPIEIGDNKLVIGASIGVSIYPDNAADAGGLLKAADAAMYRAKALGRNNCQFFSEDLNRANLARAEMERDLRLAIENGELEVYYQPIIEVAAMRIVGAEALLRWNHPSKGMISPGLFIPVAEETGLILHMGRMVLETACRQCVVWQREGNPDFEISVNVSPMQLRKNGFPLGVMDVLEYVGLPPASLNLEITETVLVKDDYSEIETLGRLRDLGITTSLDDFGIGYSSLSRLKDLPIMHMKVDGSFIRDIERSANDRAMTESIVSMAHNLGITVTAEWIENEEQMATVRDLGCDYAQGYLISPALPAEAFAQFMREWPARASLLADAA